MAKKIDIKLAGTIEFPDKAEFAPATELYIGVADAGTVTELKPRPKSEPAKSPPSGYLATTTVAIPSPYAGPIPFDVTLTGKTQVEDDHYVYVICQARIDGPDTSYVLRHDRAILCKARAFDTKQPAATTIQVGAFSFEELVVCKIKGTVKRAFGADDEVPFSGVPVTLLDDAHNELDQKVTDSLGEYCFSTDQTGRLIVRFEEEMPGTNGPFAIGQNELYVIVEPRRSFDVPTAKYEVRGARVVGQVTAGTKGLDKLPVTAIDRATREPQPGKKTDPSGHYELSLPAPGEYELAFPDPFVDKPAGKVYELDTGQPAVQIVKVEPGKIYMADPVMYRPEEHKIVWTVTSNGLPAQGKLVEVWKQSNPSAATKAFDRFVQQQRTGPDGTVIFLLDEPGEYQVLVYPDDPATIGPYKYEASVHSTHVGKSEFAPSAPRIAGSGGGTAADAVLTEAVVDTQAYPVLTESVGLTPTVMPSFPSTGAGVPLAQTADKAIREVLGWRPKTSDIKGFLVALEQSFDIKEVEGHIEWKWTPRSYAVQVQDDLGAITGAQASIYTRAKDALDASLPLLDGLFSMTPDVLPVDAEAIRAIVRSEMTLLVAELGVVGGPRVQRVDELFRFLLGSSDPLSNPEDVGGHLKELKTRFGMERLRVNSVEFEQNYTNFLILVEYVSTLNVSWRNQRQFFDRTGGVEPFLGTQLVLMSQSLTAVAEGVQEVYFTMDSVFLGASERQTLSLKFAGGRIAVPEVSGDADANQVGNTFTFDKFAAPLTIAELLDWVDRVASAEGPRLIQDAGKDGVIAFFPTINKLRKLVHGAQVVALGGLQDAARQPLPSAYGTARVQRAMAELAAQLDDAALLAGQISSQARQPRADLGKQNFIEYLHDPEFVSQLLAIIGPHRGGSPSNGGSDTAPSTQPPAGGTTPPIVPPRGSVGGPGGLVNPGPLPTNLGPLLRGLRFPSNP